jgi:hypothetical protein
MLSRLETVAYTILIGFGTASVWLGAGLGTDHQLSPQLTLATKHRFFLWRVGYCNRSSSQCPNSDCAVFWIG